jgi:hypothetical protein
MKLSIGYSGIKERSHLGCPFGIFDLYAKRKLSRTHLPRKVLSYVLNHYNFSKFVHDPMYKEIL